MRITTIFLFLFFSITAFSQSVTADFLASPLAVCVGDSVQFTDLSVSSGSAIQAWTWDFGDGNSSNAQNPAHAFGLAGTYNITLTIQLMDGTSESEVKPAYILVEEVPVVDFALNGSACNLPFAATFNNTSTTGAGYSYSWDFGNGQSSSDYSPVGITYNTAGTYTIDLIVTSPGTGCSNSSQLDIEVIDFQAGMNIPDTICLTQTGQFQDASSTNANEWTWDFGDGTATSSLENTVHTYLAAGSYTITLTAGNSALGCTSTITQTLVVLSVPTASFTVDDTYGCAPKDVTFTNTSTGATQFNWDFGDGSTFSGEFPPAHTYIDSGEYFPTLTVSDDFGCSAIFNLPSSIQVGMLETPVFTMDTLSGCDSIHVNFTDLSTALEPGNDPIVDWSWNFGNGNTYNGQNPPVETYGIGVFSPELTITTLSGCQATALYVDTIEVGSIDSAWFDLNSTLVCSDEMIDAFGYASVSPPFSPSDVLYSWGFSDGTSAISNPPVFYPSTSYSDTGFVTLMMTATVQGCNYEVVGEDSIYISGPIASFEPSDFLLCNPTLPVTIDVTDLSIIGNISDDATMTWTWGDMTSTVLNDVDLDDANQGSEQHVYNSYGMFTIEQNITNNTTGCSSTAEAIINLSYLDASQDFALWEDTICLGSYVYIDTVAGNSGIALQDTINNFYNMGDGNIYYNPWDTTGFFPVIEPIDTTHIYFNWGNYEVIHSVSDFLGCIDVDTMDIVVLDNPSAAIIADDSSGCAPLTVNFENNSTTNNNGAPIVSMEWVYTDGTSVITTDINQDGSFTFTNEGSFQTVLTVEDANGCSATAFATTNITKPTAQFLMDSVVCDVTDFTALSTSIGDDPLDYIWYVDGVQTSVTDTYTGQFNEGVSSSLSTTHDVSLVVTDANGCVDSVSNEVIVSLPQASSNFTFSGASVNQFGEFTCPPVFASFTDTSQSYGQVISWDWDFGNGNNSTLENPQNTYVFAGIYTVTLTIQDEFSCTADSTFVDFLEILGPSADPGWTNIGEYCDPEIEFYAENQNGVTNIEWDLDDTNIVNDTSAFTHIYNQAGTYGVSIVLSDDNGCQVPYDLDPITIFYDDIDAFFTTSMYEGQVSQGFTFDDQSTSTLSDIVSWDWSFTTGSISNSSDQDVDYSWTIPGEQTITLTVSDTNGCSDTYQLQVLITADFTIPNVFTPNGDEVNDFFSLDFDVFDGYDFVILNRWGNVVTDATDFTGVNMWDGKNKRGEECSEGVYFYKFVGHFHDGSTIIKQGNVTLIR